MSWPPSEFFEMEGLEDMRLSLESLETPGPAEVVAEPVFCELDCNEEAIQKPAPILWRWRRVRLAISACNRMRLVVESNQAVDAEKAEKAKTEINSSFAEASPVPLPDPCLWPTTEEGHFQWIGVSVPKFNCKYFRTPAGKLRVEMESVEAVERDFFYQVASEVSVRLDSLTSMSVGPVEGSQHSGLPNMIPVVASAQHERVFSFNDLFKDSRSSATKSAFDDPMQSGIIDQFSQGSTKSVHPSEIVQSVSDLPEASSPRMLDILGACSIREENDGMESGQCDQEQHEMSDSDFPVKTMENDPAWTELIITAVTKKISEICDEVNQASDRTKLDNTRREAKDCSTKLQKEVVHFEGEYNRMITELKTTLVRISKGVPGHIEQQLKRAISQVIFFSTKEMKRLINEAGGITKKLDKIAHELHTRNLSASKMFQNFTSSVAQFVESVLAMTSKYISTADLSPYSTELFNLPHFRKDASKGVRS